MEAHSLFFSLPIYKEKKKYLYELSTIPSKSPKGGTGKLMSEAKKQKNRKKRKLKNN